MTLSSRLFESESDEICKALVGILKVFDCLDHIHHEARVYWTYETGRHYGFTPEETENLVRGEYDNVIIGLLWHPDPSVRWQAVDTIATGNRLSQVAVKQILGEKAPAYVAGMSFEGRKILLAQAMQNVTSEN
jgi:hypothetical protein